MLTSMPSIMNFINSALPKHQRYLYSPVKKLWYHQTPHPTPGSTRPTTQIFIPKPTSADWKETLIDFLNQVINEKIKEETNAAPKIEFLSVVRKNLFFFLFCGYSNIFFSGFSK